MNSTSIYIPYTYLIKWSRENISYYGVKYSNSKYYGVANPATFWIDYFTSSRHVKEYRKLHGDPDIILIDKTFTTKEEAIAYEEYYLIKNNCVYDKNWLNKSAAGKKFIRPEVDSIETRIKKSRSHKGKSSGMLGKTHSDSYKERLRIWHKEAKIQNNRKHFLITFPDGHQEEIFGLSEFCKTHNLKRAKMYQISMTKVSAGHQGYFCTKIDKIN